MHPADLRIEEYTYDLPDDRIARYPLSERDSSKLLVFDQDVITDDHYSNIATRLPQGALMVFNQAKVVHARILFKKPTGGMIEVFCLAPDVQYADIPTAMQQRGSVLWECLVGGASKWKDGMELQLVNDIPGFVLSATIADRRNGSYLLQLTWDDANLTFAEVLHYAGKMPLPPYLRREAAAADEAGYQTVYAKDEGSVAAPTAGLHFTEAVMEKLAARGIDIAFVTLHVGAGTFIPVKSDTMHGHNMHAEWIEVTREMVCCLLDRQGMPIVAVGTTSLRTLETLYWIGNKVLNGITPDLHGVAIAQWEPYEDSVQHTATAALTALLAYMDKLGKDRLITRTQILIAPGYRFRMVTALVTNFHQPQSTLLLLVAALAGPDWRKIYDHALKHDYRFLSFGDGCLISSAVDA
jgi:S-adenosylmethionine:tRNA ribosyltransferase-isomerase